MTVYLFDFDGTLVDSMPTCVSCILGVLEEYGLFCTSNDLKAVMPLGIEGTAEFCVQKGISLTRDLVARRIEAAMLDAYFHTIPAKAHVPEVLAELKARGASLNVLTASPHITLDACLKRLGLYDLFDNVWSCDDFATTKANPEIYRMAAVRLGVPVEEVLFLDDNPNADAAARSAGMPVCGVYDPSSAEYEAEMRADNPYYIRDFSELLTLEA